MDYNPFRKILIILIFIPFGKGDITNGISPFSENPDEHSYIFGKGDISLVLSPFPQILDYSSFYFCEKVILPMEYHLFPKFLMLDFLLFRKEVIIPMEYHLFRKMNKIFFERHLERHLRTAPTRIRQGMHAWGPSTVETHPVPCTPPPK